jgi:hypothetical protein
MTDPPKTRTGFKGGVSGVLKLQQIGGMPQGIMREEQPDARNYLVNFGGLQFGEER